MIIRCHRTPAALHALAPRWNQLLQRSASNAIFLTWEWVSTWWAVFGGRFQLVLLTAEDDTGALIGIAPMMVGRRRSRSGLAFRALMLIGQRGDTLAEYLDFITEPGREAEITAAFCDVIQRELAPAWDYLFFERVLATSPNLPTLQAKLSCPRFAALRDRELTSPYAVLGSDWPAFLASKSRNFRSQWNNSWNRLQAAGDVKLLFAGQDLPLATALAEVTRLHRARWEDKSTKFKTNDYLVFHEQVCARFHANGWLLLLILSVGGENVAVRYDYVYGDKLWCMQGGWSPEYAAQRVGTLLTGKVIEWGIEHGLHEYDFLGGDSDYKRRWANGERVMVNLTACNPTTLGGFVWKGNRALEDLARRVKTRLRAERTQPAIGARPGPRGSPSAPAAPMRPAPGGPSSSSPAAGQPRPEPRRPLAGTSPRRLSPEECAPMPAARGHRARIGS